MISTIDRPPLPPHPSFHLAIHHVLIGTGLPRSNLALENVQIARPARRQVPSSVVDQRPHGAQAGAVAVPIRNHAGVLLEELDHRRDERVDRVLVARGEIRTLIVDAGELGNPDGLPVLVPVIPDVIHDTLGGILVRVDAGVVPGRLRHAERRHERREPFLVLLRRHGRRADEGTAAQFAEGGGPGRGGGGGVHVARVRGLPVRLVEAHHVFRGRGRGEVFEGFVAVAVALGGVADGGGSVGCVQVAVAPELKVTWLVLRAYIEMVRRSLVGGSERERKIWRTYHADALDSLRAAGEIGGVWPVV